MAYERIWLVHNMPKWPWFGLTPLIAKGNEEMWKSRMMQELRFFTSVDTQDVQKTWMDTWTLANTDMLVLDSPSPRKMLPDTSMYIKRHEACRRRAWQHGDWYEVACPKLIRIEIEKAYNSTYKRTHRVCQALWIPHKDDAYCSWTHISSWSLVSSACR